MEKKKTNKLKKGDVILVKSGGDPVGSFLEVTWIGKHPAHTGFYIIQGFNSGFGPKNLEIEYRWDHIWEVKK